MRGRLRDQSGLFSYIRPEERIPATHPLRKVRELVREVLKELSHGFGKLYSHEGRPSIPPEQLVSALLLQVFYGIRSERQLMEQLDCNLLYRWFVGLSPDDLVWDPTVFTKNREAPRTAAAMMTAGPTSMAKSARTTRMRARPIPTADFTARQPGGRRSSATWATPRWRTGMGWRWPAWSRSPPAPLSGALRRRCSRPKSRSSADALR